MTYWLVVGMPRGGTSLVAKMMVNIGVNMGDRFVRPDPYPRYEDKRLWDLARPISDMSPEKSAGIAAYMRERIESVDGPVGGKFPILTRYQAVKGWKEWPIRVIHVHRPLEEVIWSDAKNYKRKQVDRAKIKRVQNLAERWYRQQRFLEHHKPALVLHHSENTRNPAKSVKELARVVLGEEISADLAREIAQDVIEDPSQWRTHDARSELARGPSDLDELRADPVGVGADPRVVEG